MKRLVVLASTLLAVAASHGHTALYAKARASTVALSDSQTEAPCEGSTTSCEGTTCEIELDNPRRQTGAQDVEGCGTTCNVSFEVDASHEIVHDSLSCTTEK